MTAAYPNIPEVTPSGRTSRDFNTVQHWGFLTRDDLAENNGKLLMLDIDLGRDCSLRCPWCFRRRHGADSEALADLDYDALLRVIDDAGTIGLREVKVCGAGEPLENPALLCLARDLTRRGIGLAVFTKGHVLGDDAAVNAVFGSFGISTGEALCQAFFELNTSFLVGFQSAKPDVQDRLVGSVSGYTTKRNRGLELLAAAGFNKTVPTRLALCTNPLVRDNYGDVLEIYKYARKRNILPVIAMLMVSGKQIGSRFLARYDVTPEEKERLFIEIYRFNLEFGYHTEEGLREEGVSCLPGIHPCNQIAAGLYVMANGSVVRCPGDGGKPLGNVQEENIVDIWRRHRDWEYRGHFNCGCPFKDGITLPEGIYKRVLDEVILTRAGAGTHGSH